MSTGGEQLTARLQLARQSFHLDVELEVPARGVTSLFGASGAGKTTILRCIAGLERGAIGTVRIGERVWQDDTNGVFVPAHRRGVGYVFQDANLFPHLNVAGNLRYAESRVPRGERRLALTQIIGWLGIEELLRRRPGDLSGGERQRVAIARALASHPSLLLLDEPLSSLDEPSRQSCLACLEVLPEQLAIPILHVSHSLREVARLADQVVRIEAGRVLQRGPVQEMVTSLDLLRSQGDDLGAVLETTVERHDEEFQLTALAGPCGILWVRRLERPLGSSVRVQVLARDVSLALAREEHSSLVNQMPCRVVALVDPESWQVTVRLEAGQGGSRCELLARVTRKSCVHLGLVPGQRVVARVKGVGLL
jgi:molybdate transport system ATP-binding protein